MSSIHVNANAGLNDTEKYFGNYIGLVIQTNKPIKEVKLKDLEQSNIKFDIYLQKCRCQCLCTVLTPLLHEN